jgi:hypothetical protein
MSLVLNFGRKQIELFDEMILKGDRQGGPMMQFHKMLLRKECPLRAEYAQEHRAPGIRLDVSPVMLSVAKQLHGQGERPFAAAQSFP